MSSPSVSSVAMAAAAAFSFIEVTEPSTSTTLSLVTSNAVYLCTTTGRVLKLALPSLALVATVDVTQLPFTAACEADNGHLVFAAGTSQPIVYRLTPDLQVLGQTEASFAGPINAMATDRSTLVTLTPSVVHMFDITSAGLVAASVPSVALPVTAGPGTVLLLDRRSTPATALIGTQDAPAGVMRFTLGTNTVRTLRLHAGEDRINTGVIGGKFAYFGLGTATTVQSDNTPSPQCFVAKVDLDDFTEADMVVLEPCVGDLVSAAVNAELDLGMFGSSSKPAQVFAVALRSYPPCPDDCSGHGRCVKGMCLCDEFFTSDNCHVDTRLCKNDCSHHGTCHNAVCTCEPGFGGDDCSVQGDKCAQLCVHGACTGTGNTFPCVCSSASWTGALCDQSTCPADCSHRGTCTNGRCVCEPGFRGDDCSQRVEGSSPSLQSCVRDADCNNPNAECVGDVTDGHGQCVCRAGYAGENCEPKVKAEEEAGMSVVVVGLLVFAALILGMVVGVTVWKRYMGPQALAASVTSMDAGVIGEAKSRVVAGGYTRLPRRLAK